ncbi:MAG: UDP-N-acetyl glucosamine 2-epimerase [Ferruginibacter sp.]
MKTIVHVVGNRPQFIKLAVLYNEISGNESSQQQIVHTGQHFSYNMSGLFFKELHLPEPTINLNIQSSSSNLFIGETSEALQAYFLQQNNIIVFVYGDTNTTLAAAMAAKRCNIPLVHFEAGVRTYEFNMPEEINRTLTDRLSDVNYCCTGNNYAIMRQEGYGTVIDSQVALTGDLMLDAFLKISHSDKRIATHPEYIATTVHRDANLCDKNALVNIVKALNELHKTIPVVMPVHPHTKKKMSEFGIEALFEVIDPLGYPDMKNLLANASYVITDSGGTCREAYFLQKRSLIIMDTPFWPEIIAQNCSLSCSANKEKILSHFLSLDSLHPDFGTNIFGDGNAAQKIHLHLNAYLASDSL